ncbi:MAG: OmpA family protein [Candidatus Kapaibacterium sp.]
MIQSLRHRSLTLIMLLGIATAMQAQRFDPDEVWNLQPPTDTTFRNIYLLPQFGTGLHLTSGLECLDGGGCTPFTGGSGSVMNIGFGIDQVLSSSWTGVAMVSMNIWDVTMTTTDGAARVRMPDGSITNMVRELTMKANGTTIGVSVGALFRSGAFMFTAAPLVDIAMGPRWSQSGTILSPAGVAYPDGSTSAVIIPDVAIPNAAPVRVGLLGTAGYEVVLSEKFSIVPTLAVQYLPTPIRSGASWSDLRITGGVALRMEANDLPDTVERIRIYQKIDTVKITRDGDRSITKLIEGIPAITSDTVRKGLLHQITSHVQRTDTLLTLEVKYTERIAEERRAEQVKIETERKIAEVKAKEEAKRDAEARTAEEKIARAKAAEAKRPKPKISIGGKTLPLKARVKNSTTDGSAGAETSTDEPLTRTIYVTVLGDTVDLLNRDVANQLAIKLTSERQELTFMILPSVFFDSASSELSERYRRLSSTKDYKPGENMTDQHQVNLDILNIFAYRIRNASQTLIIRGYADPTSEAASCDIAHSRAESIARYLTDVWQIPSGKIRVEVGDGSCAPNPASSGSTLRGRQENRRVEFLSDDYDYFMPVQDQKVFLKPEWDFSRADIDFDDTLDPVRQWSTTFTQGKRTFAVNEGTGRFDKSSVVISDSVLSTLSADSVLIRMKVITESGEELEAALLIGVGQVQKDLKFSSLSLAMFAVRSTELGKRDLELLKSFAKRLDPGDRVAVLGYTDDLGNAATNQQLAAGRAQSVAERLRALRPDCVITRVEGLANTRYALGVTSYNTPEQRFMSRTVQLVLEKQ